MFKKALIIVVIFVSFCTEGSAQAHKFEALILPSLADIDLDAWYKIPPNSGPSMRKTDQVVKNQLFSLFIIFKGYSVDSANKMDITYDVQIFDPQGQPTEDKGLGIVGYHGLAGSSDILLLNQQIMRVLFSDDYPYGTYQIKVTAYDNVSGNTFKTSTAISLLPISFEFRFSNLDEANAWMMHYYQEMSPQKAVAAVQAIVQTEPGWIVNNVNILSFFSRIFADNPYLLSNIAENFDQFSLPEQKRLLLIDHFVGDNQLIRYSQKKTFSDFKQQLKAISYPTLNDEISKPLQLDMLWSEFLATGRYAPIKKIVGALALVKYKGTLEKIKQDKLALSDELKREAYLDATYQSAVWSLLSNNKQMPLVNKYCHFIYQNEDLSGNIKRQLALILRRVQLESSNTTE